MQPTRSDHLSDEDLARLGLSRRTELRLDAAGRFWNGPDEVAHPAVAAAFARWIDRGPDGRYVLRNDLHYVYLEVEGAPLHAGRARSVDGGQAVVLELTSGEDEPLRPETLRQGPDEALYASGRDGSWPVRLGYAAALDLGPLLEADGDEVVLRLGGRRWPIPRVADPLAPPP